MRTERLEKRASEKELVAQPSSNKDVSLKNQKLAESLRSRIEELDRRLAILNSERGVRRMDDTCAVATLTAISGWSWLKSGPLYLKTLYFRTIYPRVGWTGIFR